MKHTTSTTSDLTARIEAARKIHAEIKAIPTPSEIPANNRKLHRLIVKRDAFCPADMLLGKWISLVCSE